MNKSGLDIQTVEAYSVKEIEVYLKNILADTTIFIDIDETIIAPYSSSFRIATNKDLIAGIKVPQHFPNRDDIISSWRMQRKAILVDDSWSDFIERFKKHKSVYGLTKMNSGKLGKIESLQKWRVEELAKFSINFTQNLAIENFIVNVDYEINPMFYKGIFFTGGATKGDTIKLFNKILKVNSIVLIDDTYDHLNSMKIFCEFAGVNFLGIHFKGGERLPGIYNHKLAKFQEKYLIENHIWLEDKEAEKFID